jgi:lysophospholipase L1-like esterase
MKIRSIVSNNQSRSRFLPILSPPPSSRRWLVRLRLPAALLAVAHFAGTSATFAAGPQSDHHSDAHVEEHWVGTWATGPAGPAGAPKQYSDQTLRLIVHTSVGGDRVRIKISNAFGTGPLIIGAAHVARRSAGAKITAGTDRAVTFSGQPSFSIPTGALVLSDPVSLPLPPLSDLAVSIYLPGVSIASTTHLMALQTSYIAAGTGDFTGDADLAGATPTTFWDFLTGVDVSEKVPAATIVAFGDSITDGVDSTIDTNHRWPNHLAERLQSRDPTSHFGVLDEGIIGNRILHPTEPKFGNLFAPPGLARFDRDVLSQAGVKFVIVLLGINDIGHPGADAPASDFVSPDDITAAYLQLIGRAHQHGIRIYGCTLTPFEGTVLPGYFSPAKENLRQAVNRWIRTSGAFDAVIDFDQAARDPGHPARFLPAFDGGDHLHPSDAGLKAMADAIDLNLFRLDH